MSAQPNRANGTMEEGFRTITQEMRDNAGEIIALSQAEGLRPRDAAERVTKR